MAASTYQLISNTEDMSQDGDGYYTVGWIVPPCGMDPDIRGDDANSEPMDSVNWPVTEDPEEGVRLMDRALAEDGWYRVSDWRVDGAEWAADIERLPILWTITDVANHFGVSESRARAILAKHRIERITGYPAAAVKAIQRPGQGARTDLKGATMPGTQLHGWGSYDLGEMTLEDFVRVYLGDFVEDYDTEALSTAFRDAINEGLEKDEIVLAGSDFYSRVYPAPENSSDLIRQAVEDVDLGKLAAKFDRSSSSAGVRLFDDAEEAAMERAHSPEGRATVRQEREKDFNQALIEWRTTTDPTAVTLAEERLVFLSVELRELLKPYVDLVLQERQAHEAKVAGMDFMDVFVEIPPFQPSQEALAARRPFEAKLAELTEQFGF